MQPAQRGSKNPELDLAIAVGDELELPGISFVAIPASSLPTLSSEARMLG
jgi:hypothetical protein